MYDKDFKCEKCRYYLRHYYSKDGTRFINLNSGHCSNAVLYEIRKKNKCALQKNCEFFEEDVDRTKREVEAVENVIRQPHDKLNQIEQLLNFLKN